MEEQEGGGGQGLTKDLERHAQLPTGSGASLLTVTRYFVTYPVTSCGKRGLFTIIVRLFTLISYTLPCSPYSVPGAGAPDRASAAQAPPDARRYTSQHSTPNPKP